MWETQWARQLMAVPGMRAVDKARRRDRRGVPRPRRAVSAEKAFPATLERAATLPKGGIVENE